MHINLGGSLFESCQPVWKIIQVLANYSINPFGSIPPVFLQPRDKWGNTPALLRTKEKISQGFLYVFYSEFKGLNHCWKCWVRLQNYSDCEN